MHDAILNKLENYRLCHAGAYGNRLLQWQSIEEWRISGYAGRLVMRTALRAGGGPKAFNVEPHQVDDVAQQWARERGVPRDRIRLSEMGRGLRVLQGQYFNGVCAMDGEAISDVFKLTVATDAIAKKTVFGLTSRVLVRHFMTPSSFSDFQVLLEQYPDHVLEFSVWESCIGDTPGRNAVVWEVRRY